MLGSLKVNFQPPRKSFKCSESFFFFLGRFQWMLFPMNSCWASSKGTFTLLSTFAYKVKAEKTCFTLIVCSFIVRVNADPGGFFEHPLSLSSIILLRFLKTHFKFTALYLPLACSKPPWGSEEDYAVFSDTLSELVRRPLIVLYMEPQEENTITAIIHIYCIET